MPYKSVFDKGDQQSVFNRADQPSVPRPQPSKSGGYQSVFDKPSFNPPALKTESAKKVQQESQDFSLGSLADKMYSGYKKVKKFVTEDVKQHVQGISSLVKGDSPIETFANVVDAFSNPGYLVRKGIEENPEEVQLFADSLKTGTARLPEQFGKALKFQAGIMEAYPELIPTLMKANPITAPVGGFNSVMQANTGNELVQQMSLTKQFQDKVAVPLFNSSGDFLKNYSQEVIENNPQWQHETRLRTGGTLDDAIWNLQNEPIQYLAKGVGENAPLFVVQLATALTTGGLASMTLMGGIAGGETYEEALEFGTSQEKAVLLGGVRGVVESSLERLGLDKAFKLAGGNVVKDGIVSKVANNILARIGSGALTEGATEALQEIVANVIATSYDENREWWQGAADAGIIGAVFGGGTVGIGSGINSVTQQSSGGDANVFTSTDSIVPQINSATEFNAQYQAMPTEMLFKGEVGNPNTTTLTQEFAKSRAGDIEMKLNEFYPNEGLGTEFKKKINLENTTLSELNETAFNVVANSGHGFNGNPQYVRLRLKQQEEQGAQQEQAPQVTPNQQEQEVFLPPQLDTSATLPTPIRTGGEFIRQQAGTRVFQGDKVITERGDVVITPPENLESIRVLDLRTVTDRDTDLAQRAVVQVQQGADLNDVFSGFSDQFDALIGLQGQLAGNFDRIRAFSRAARLQDLKVKQVPPSEVNDVLRRAGSVQKVRAAQDEVLQALTSVGIQVPTSAPASQLAFEGQANPDQVRAALRSITLGQQVQPFPARFGNGVFTVPQERSSDLLALQTLNREAEIAVDPVDVLEGFLQQFGFDSLSDFFATIDDVDAVKNGDVKKVSDTNKLPSRVKAREQSDKLLTKDEATEIVRKYFTEEELGVQFVDQIRTPKGQVAIGEYFDQMITFVNNPKTGVPEHEVLHAYMDMFATTKQKNAVLNDVKERYDIKSNEQAEEILADEFAQWVQDNDSSQAPPKTKGFFSRVWDKLKMLVGKQNQVEKMFKDIQNRIRPSEAQEGMMADARKELEQGRKFKLAEDQPEIVTASEIAEQELTDAGVTKKEAKKILREVRKEVISETAAKFNKKIEGILTEKEKTKRRKQRVQAVRDYFGLSDTDLKKISTKDVRLMTDYQFKLFIDEITSKAYRFAEKRQAKNELMQRLKDMELQKVENLQKAMKLPTIAKMSESQIREFNAELTKYQIGDRFLSQRMIETGDRGDLGEARTEREVKELLGKKLGVSFDEINEIKFLERDRFLYDTALAERNEFYKLMVDEFNKQDLITAQNYLDKKATVEELTKKARQSRKRGLKERAVPKDELVFRWLESNETDKETLAKQMTDEEMDLAIWMRTEFERMRDVLLEYGTLKKYRQNYVTHRQRTFLEALVDDGLRAAMSEVFKRNQLQEEVFNIVDDTGNILAFEKFFGNALSRTENGIVPTQNVAAAYLGYLQNFEKKMALDAIIPELMAYVRVLTPKQQTERGLLKDNRLEKFVKEWINTKKGRTVTTFSVKQGSKIDTVMKGMMSFISIMDLGLNLTTGAGAVVGETISNWRSLGTKRMALGAKRQATPKGRKIAKQYSAFVGENPAIQILQDATSDIKDKALDTMFVLFSQSSFEANINYLLGSMTKEEYESGEITPERLAQLKREMGRFRVVGGQKSVYGSATLGRAYTQYKSWAIPHLMTTYTDLVKLKEQVKNDGIGAIKDSEEFYATMRGTVGGLAFGLMVMAAAGALAPEDDDSFIAKLQEKVVRESFTSISAFDPTLWVGGRSISFLDDIANDLKSILLLETYKTKPGLKGVSGLQRHLTPRFIKQIQELFTTE